LQVKNADWRILNIDTSPLTIANSTTNSGYDVSSAWSDRLTLIYEEA